MSKKFIIIKVIIVLFLLMTFVSCKKIENSASLYFKSDSITIEVFEEINPEIYIENFHEESLILSSADNSILSVNEGLIYGIKEGKTWLTVSGAKSQAKCLVNVIRNKETPVIITNYENLKLNVNSYFPLSANVFYKGNLIHSAEINWETENEFISADALTGNKVNIFSLKNGETAIKITANYCGQVLTKEVFLTISSDLVLEVENLQINDLNYQLTLLSSKPEDIEEINLYTKFKPVLKLNGQITDSIEWISENQSVALVNELGEISAIGSGQTKIKAIYRHLNDIAFVDIEIFVIKPSRKISESLEIETKRTNPSIILSGYLLENQDILSVEIDGIDIFKEFNPSTFEISLLSEKTSLMEVGQKQLTLETNQMLYKMPVNIISMVIKNSSDLDLLADLSKLSSNTWTGHWKLGNNIDYQGKIFYTFCGELEGASRTGDSGWIGIFDGQGYYIKNIRISGSKSSWDNYAAGFFGIIGKTGIVKNLSLINVEFKSRSGSVLAEYNFGTIDNVFISGKVNDMDGYLPWGSRTLVASYGNGAISNMIVEYIGDNYYNGAAAFTQGLNYSDCYFIGKGVSAVWEEANSGFVYRYHTTSSTFSSINDFNLAKTTLSFKNFQTNIWTFYTNIPLFIRHLNNLTENEILKYI